jgi:hypothetical protein
LLIGFREEHLNGNKLCKTPANARKPMHTDPSTILNGFIREQRKNRPDPSWGLIERRGRRYYIHEKTLNSLIGMRSYQASRRLLSRATEELTILDTLPD